MLKEQNTSNQREIIEKVLKILKERNAKPLEMAKKEVLHILSHIESTEIQEALNYFIKEQWEETRSYVLGPTLISLACEAVGGNAEMTIPIAASIILIGSGIEMHDDIIDKSMTKKSSPTVLGKFGTNTTLVAGRTLMVNGLTLLREASCEGVPAEKIASISNIIQKAFFEFGDAEGLALELRGSLDVAPEKCLPIIRMKGSIIEGQARIGAMMGGGTREEIEALGKYGRILGTLSTIRGEFTDMFEVDELHHRMTNEYLPLPILYGLQNTKAKKKIIHILCRKRLTKKEVSTLVNIVYDTKQVKNLKKRMRKLAEEADVILSPLVQSKSTETLKLFILATLEGL